MADYVTTESGTGCVHTAPGHGLDDYLTGMQNGLDIYCPIDDSGCYIDDGQVPSELVGLSVLETEGQISEANKAVLKIIARNGSLIAKRKLSIPILTAGAPRLQSSFAQWTNGSSIYKRTKCAPTHCRPSTALNSFRNGEKTVFMLPSLTGPIGASAAKEPGAYPSQPSTMPKVKPTSMPASSDRWQLKLNKPGVICGSKKSALELLDGIETPASWPAASELSLGTDTLDVWIDSGSSHQAVLKKAVSSAGQPIYT